MAASPCTRRAHPIGTQSRLELRPGPVDGGDADHGAHLQGFEAADGTRTHDLLHSKQTMIAPLSGRGCASVVVRRLGATGEQLAELVRRHGPREVVALSEVAAEVAQ
jgi:hypothetical protein